MPGISWWMLLLVYNVHKSLTVAPAIKRLTPASLAMKVLIYHQLLSALPVPLSHHNAHSAAMHRLAHPAISIIIWPTPPLVWKFHPLLIALITHKVWQPVSSAIQVTFYRQAPPAPVVRLLLHIVPSALLLLLAFNVLVAIIYQVQLPVFLALQSRNVPLALKLLIYAWRVIKDII
jgi:hypothetical protein